MEMSYRQVWQAQHPDQVYVTGLSCTLCNWPAAVRGGTVSDMLNALKEHEWSHADWDEFQAQTPKLSELKGILQPTVTERQQSDQPKTKTATFEGNIYIRPLNRGVCFGDDMEDFEDWLTRMLGIGEVSAGGQNIQARITVERLITDTNE